MHKQYIRNLIHGSWFIRGVPRHTVTILVQHNLFLAYVLSISKAWCFPNNKKKIQNELIDCFNNMLGNLSCFSRCLLSFSNFSKNYFRNTISVAKGLNPDQDRHSVGPDLVLSVCKGYKQTTKVAASKERVNYTVKPVLKGHSQKDQKLVFETNYGLMQVKSIAECSKGSILQYFRPSLTYQLSLRPLFCLSLSGRFRQVVHSRPREAVGLY